jgi:hypothetical protein
MAIMCGTLFAMLEVTAEEPLEIKQPEFEKHIHPIFREYCFDCHGATDKPEGGWICDWWGL